MLRTYISKNSVFGGAECRGNSNRREVLVMHQRAGGKVFDLSVPADLARVSQLGFRGEKSRSQAVERREAW